VLTAKFTKIFAQNWLGFKKRCLVEKRAEGVRSEGHSRTAQDKSERCILQRISEQVKWACLILSFYGVHVFTADAQ
jgi:hypothetical protein